MRTFARRACPSLLVIGMLACGERGLAAPEAALPAAPPAPPRGDFYVPPPELPRGLVQNAPGVTPGYVLFGPSLSDTAYLVDNQGRVVDPAALGFKAGGTGGILQELAWDGSVVWE
jgi:hypothetical protein